MKDKEKVTGLLAQGTHFEGNLSFSGTVRVGGSFKGEILADGVLIIEEGASVEAQVKALKVFVSGNFSGNIEASHSVTMFPPAQFKGSVSAPSLKIEEGVMFEGSSKRTST